MLSRIYWLEGFSPGRLGTMARPRGGDWLQDEVAGWKQRGLDVVASALTDEEMRELDILDEGKFCHARNIEFRRFPINDRGLPSLMTEWATFIGALRVSIDEKKAVVAHCRMGIGRASIIAVSVMVTYGMEPDEAFRRMAQARGMPVPDTDEQRVWRDSPISSMSEATRE